jgi:hypothetical protein
VISSNLLAQETQGDVWKKLVTRDKNSFVDGMAIGYDSSIIYGSGIKKIVEKDYPEAVIGVEFTMSVLQNLEPSFPLDSRFEGYVVSSIDNFFSTPGHEDATIQMAFINALDAWRKAIVKMK